MRHRLRLVRSSRVLRGLLVAVAIAAGLLVGSGYLLASSSTNSCTAALKVRDAFRDVLLDAQQRTRESPAQTAREQDRQRALAFYDRSLKRLGRVSCST